MRKIFSLLCLFTTLPCLVFADDYIQKYLSEAEKGESRSQLELVRYYYKAKENSQVEYWGMKLLDNEKGTDNEKGIVCEILGLMYIPDRRVRQEDNVFHYAKTYAGVDEKTEKYWKLGVDFGNSSCAFHLAKAYEYRKDKDKAFEWYVKAADLGDNESCRLVARQYDDFSTDNADSLANMRIANLKPDIVKSVMYYEKYIMSLRDYFVNKDSNILVKEKDPAICCLLAEIYFYGRDKIMKDYLRAVSYYENALSYELENMPDVEYKIVSRKLTDEEMGEAMWNLSTCYRFGRGVVKNELKAYRLTRMAAEKGNEKAIKLLKNY